MKRLEKMEDWEGITGRLGATGPSYLMVHLVEHNKRNFMQQQSSKKSLFPTIMHPDISLEAPLSS